MSFSVYEEYIYVDIDFEAAIVATGSTLVGSATSVAAAFGVVSATLPPWRLLQRRAALGSLQYLVGLLQHLPSAISSGISALAVV